MITNAEARDKYNEDYKRASNQYSDICRESENCQILISDRSSVSQQLDCELRSLQGSIDLYIGLLSICQEIKDEDCEDEKNQINEYASNFQNSITHSEISIDIESYYIGNIRNIVNCIDDMIQKIKSIIVSLEAKNKDVANQKIVVDEEISAARLKLNNMESKGSISARMEESYQWYRYYLNKCEEEGEETDSGL